MSSGTNFALHVSWDLPSFPNGEIKRYDVEYVKTSGEGPATTIPVTGLSHVIPDLPTFTFYNVTVRAFNDLIGFPTSKTERTNASGEPHAVDNSIGEVCRKCSVQLVFCQ